MKMLKPLKLRQALEQKDIWLEQMANLADKNAFMRKQASAGGRGCEDDAGRRRGRKRPPGPGRCRRSGTTMRRPSWRRGGRAAMTCCGASRATLSAMA